jgi:hypothetical protein
MFINSKAQEFISALFFAPHRSNKNNRGSSCATAWRTVCCEHHHIEKAPEERPDYDIWTGAGGKRFSILICRKQVNSPEATIF